MYTSENIEPQIALAAFSKKVLRELAQTGCSKTVAQSYERLQISPEPNATVGELFEFYYELLQQYYCSEYVYKNTLALECLRQRHEDPEVVYTQEFRTLSSIADVLIVNGTTTVYEIKSEYDSFDRLDGQLTDYSKVFGKINLVVPQSKLDGAFDRTPEYVGVIELGEDFELQVHREAKDNVENVQNQCIFSCLRKSEYQLAIKAHFGELPASRPSSLWRKCQDLFETLPPRVAHQCLVDALKQRFSGSCLVGNVFDTPSLTSLLMTSNLKRSQTDHLYQLLQEPITTLLE